MSKAAAHETAKQDDLLASTSTAVAAKPTGSMVAIGDKIKALDAFAEANSLALLTTDKGQFESAIMVADAITHLKSMLTAEVMKPIMALQGTSIGYRTDKDATGGYPVEVVRDAFIDVVLKGFKVVGNEFNIIAGRAYFTREGYEGALLRLSRLGHFSDFQDAYSIPKMVSDSEAIVTASASWKFKGVVGKIENAQFSIRMNKGMGADGAIGKAKRKLKARVHERVTGIAATEGDTSDGPVIDVHSTPVTGTGTAVGQAPVMATEEQKTELTKKIGPHAEKANAWLLQHNAIRDGGTFLDVTEKTATKILGNVPGFLTTIGATE
jgi:hypothetical protein